MNYKTYFSFMILYLATATYPLDMTVQEFQISSVQKNVQLDLALDNHEQILKQTLSVSIDNPHATIGQISITPVATKQYLPEFADSKEIFNKNTSKSS